MTESNSPAPHRLSAIGIKFRTALTGKKVSIDSILDKDVEFRAAWIEPSKYNQGKDRLRIQVIKDGEELIIFTGSEVLMDQFKQILDVKGAMPFVACITKISKYYTLQDKQAEEAAPPPRTSS